MKFIYWPSNQYQQRNMSRIAVVAASLALSLAGCANSPQQKAQLTQDRAELANLKEQAKIHCASRNECERAFTLTKLYVQQTADMRVANSDSNYIETYAGGSIGSDLVGMSAQLVSDARDGGEISLVAVCEHQARGYVSDPSYGVCMQKLRKAYTGFKPFVVQRLPR